MAQLMLNINGHRQGAMTASSQHDSNTQVERNLLDLAACHELLRATLGPVIPDVHLAPAPPPQVLRELRGIHKLRPIDPAGDVLGPLHRPLADAHPPGTHRGHRHLQPVEEIHSANRAVSSGAVENDRGKNTSAH